MEQSNPSAYHAHLTASAPVQAWWERPDEYFWVVHDQNPLTARHGRFGMVLGRFLGKIRLIVSSYPTITLSDVHAALAYYYENRKWIDADIEEGQKFVDAMKALAGPSRLQDLLQARKANGQDDPI
jgi:hypothetical protein